MIKELIEFLDYGLFAELALAIFALVFIALVIKTLTTRKEVTNQQAAIVLRDDLPGSSTDRKDPS